MRLSPEGFAAYQGHVTQLRAIVRTLPRDCDTCGREFQPRAVGRLQRFCRPECRAKGLPYA